MRTYGLTCSMLGTDYVSIRAKSRLLAEEAFYDMALDDLVLFTDFNDGIELMSIEMQLTVKKYKSLPYAVGFFSTTINVTYRN